MDFLKFEKNYFKKKWTNRISIALIFPNYYSLAMSNLGYLYIYQRLNSFSHIVCERVCLPEANIMPTSIESNRPLKDFDILMSSISFEVDYINLLKILIASGINPEAKKREKILIAGGIALWLNPKPLYKFVDAFVIAEWEAIEKDFVEVLTEHFHSKKQLLSKLNEFSYTWIPSLEPQKKVRVKKKYPLEMPPVSYVLSEKTEFKNTYLVEVARGCGMGCRFCAAGYVYRPPREYSSQNISEVFSSIPKGAKVGIIGFEFANKKEVISECKKLLEKGCTLSFSSVRLDTVDPEFFDLLKNTKSVAIAPETGSEKLKKVLNKDIPTEKVLEVLELLKESGLKTVKLYFILGLPTEEKKDLDATINFVKFLLNSKIGLKFLFSFSFLVPKPHTPFQWSSFLDVKILEERKKYILKNLKLKDIKIENPRDALLQTLIIRGDESTSELLITLAKGGKLKRVLKELKLPWDKYLSPEEDLSFEFPWDFIDTWVSKEFLWKEWQMAKSLKLGIRCKPFECKACSACVFEEYKG